MNALREREINNNLERKLSEEQKLRGEFDLRLFSGPRDIQICIRFLCHNSLRSKKGKIRDNVSFGETKASNY